MAEFSYNNPVTMGNGISPFYANYGFHPRTMDLPSENKELVNPTSMVYRHWMKTIQEDARKGLEMAQERMRRYADPNRNPPPAHQVGDLVMLNGRNIKTRRPSRKMDHKNHGPFQIEKIISCHEHGATGSLALVPVPPSPLSPCGLSLFPLPQPRSSSVLRRLAQVPAISLR